MDFTEFIEKVEGSIVLPMTGEEQSTLYIKDVVYAAYGELELHLQILLPTSPAKRMMPPMPEELRKQFGLPEFTPDWSFPLIVYVPGSAWAKQNVYGEIADLSRYVDRGFAVAVVEYRDYTLAPFPAPIVDARNAVRFMRKNAKQFAVDPGRIILAGNSSGGHTAAYAGIFHDDDEDTNLYPGVSAEVNGIINFYGSTDFTFPDSNPITAEKHNKPDSPEGMEMGGVDLDENPDLRDKLTVACNITKETDIVPMLIFHGTADRVVNCKCSVNLYRKLKECGKDVSLYLLKGSDHGGPEFFAPRILQIVSDFALKVFA
ncbi:MAG: alpha/beta hydrolase [Lachnospiraceae bacterium]|nr:alpha/beta hydrolase [Lachnospiraceae bacterium]